MSLIGHALGLERRALMSTPELAERIADRTTATGRRLDTDRALSQGTVFACVRLIAESGGMIPLLLYRRLTPKGKERATEHPLFDILHSQPNPESTPIELFENILGHLCLWGNAYCEIEYDRAGRRRAIWLLRPDRMTVNVVRNERVYEYNLPDGNIVTLGRRQVWHIRGWGTDAWLGKSPITLAREAIGLALATEEAGNLFFGNDSRPGGVLRYPGKLSKEAGERLKASWEGAHQGLTHKQRVAVLEEGVEWQSIGIPPNEAQFLETREFQQTQICTIYRVPPHMIGIVSKSTSWGTGIEQQSIGYVTYTLGPYLTRIAQSVSRDLLTPAERNIYFAEHLRAALVMGDLQTRYTAYNMGRMGGWLSANDIREAENLNPIEGGDTYLQPLNMAPLGSESMPVQAQNTEVDNET